MDSLYDRRILTLFVNSAFPAEKFPLFKMPDDASMQNVNTLLGQNTADDGPELLGLHANANATVARSALWSTYRMLSVFSSVGNEFDPSVSVHQKVTQLLLDYPNASDDVQVRLDDSPAVDFLSMERLAAHRHLKMITSDLNALGVNSNSAVLTAHLRSVSSALSKKSVPIEWRCDWLEVESIDEWLEEVFRRAATLDELAMRVCHHSLLISEPVPLFATRRPSAFLAALFQTAARMKRTELSDLKLVATFTTPINAALITLNICDLALQAAVVKGSVVVPSEVPDHDLFKLENVFLSVCGSNMSVTRNVVGLPMFESVERRRFVAEVEVPVEAADEVILCSAAFVFNY
jgi:hypothetical protein